MSDEELRAHWGMAPDAEIPAVVRRWDEKWNAKRDREGLTDRQFREGRERERQEILGVWK